MDAYMYQYSCPGDWYGNYNGLRNVYTSKELSDEDAINLAKDDLKKSLGHRDCGVSLLVKYKLSIESVKTYPSITKIPFSESKNSKKISLD
tara:strand:+ start:110 stop:382 length:273 start_codon:yes stop_codon:yes gene_type:complete